MIAHPQALNERPQYRFSLVGLTANDAQLFSSLFRLLSTRMRHKWLPVAAQEIRALTLVGDAATEEEIVVAQMRGDILRIGHQVNDRERALCFPLRPTEILKVFDRVGDTLDRGVRRLAMTSLAPHATATAPQVSPATSTTQPPLSIRAALAATEIAMSIGADGRVIGKPSDAAANTNTAALSATSGIKLLRWPSQQLLSESGDHLKLASLVVYRATTIEELQQRSGVTEHSCRSFVTRMLAEGHAIRIGIEANRAAPAKQNPAVDTRTSRLIATNSMLAANAKRQGIIAFIRRRLSI